MQKVRIGAFFAIFIVFVVSGNLVNSYDEAKTETEPCPTIFVYDPISRFELTLYVVSSAFSFRSRKGTDVPEPTFVAERDPIVLIPGLGGSRLIASLEKHEHSPHIWCPRVRGVHTIWIDLWDLLPSEIECWIENLSVRPVFCLRILVKFSEGLITIRVHIRQPTAWLWSPLISEVSMGLRPFRRSCPPRLPTVALCWIIL